MSEKTIQYIYQCDYLPKGVTSKNAIGAPRVATNSSSCNLEDVPEKKKKN
jgi:hypothetical protein